MKGIKTIKNFDMEASFTTISDHLTEILNKGRDNLPEDIYGRLFACIDYTMLNTTDNDAAVLRLVEKVNGFEKDLQKNVAALCVFPCFVELVRKNLKTSQVKIVSVSASFPFSQTYLEVKLLETQMLAASAVDEIDIVMPIGKLASWKEGEIVKEIAQIKAACHGKHLKVILETGMLNDAKMIETASMLAIEGGADFIKTSTGKNGSVASAEAFYIMCATIAQQYKEKGKKIGIKPAGGISKAHTALEYALIVQELLGMDWLHPATFRIGASTLVDDMLKYI
jgi:deoxyribose-phosphate aldolase